MLSFSLGHRPYAWTRGTRPPCRSRCDLQRDQHLSSQHLLPVYPRSFPYRPEQMRPQVWNGIGHRSGCPRAIHVLEESDGFCHLRNRSHLEIFSFTKHVMALSRKACYYLWSSAERTGLFLKEMFCKTCCGSLIRAGNGPMLGYQPHKGAYLPAGFLSIPPLPDPLPTSRPGT